MRLLAAVLLVFVLIVTVLWAAQPVKAKAEPFHIYQTVESARSGTDPTCYADDHTLAVRAAGYLPTGRWSYTSPMRVCNEKIVRGALSSERRSDASLTVIDMVGDVHPGREVLIKGNRGPSLVRYACNSDSKTDIQLMLEDAADRPPMTTVTWIVDVESPGTYRLEMVLDEPWFQGESTYGYCEHTP